MPAITKTKGDLGQAMVMADALKRGYKIALPLGEDWRFDLIVMKEGKLIKVQCKYVEATDGYIKVRCESHDGRSYYKYKQNDVDYIAVYDKITNKCYYVSNSYLGENGRGVIHLRFKKAKNGQRKKILDANKFTEF